MSWLRSARTADGELVDVEIAGGLIAQVIAGDAAALAAGDVDLSGQVLLPSFVEPHAHLDKALTASRAANRTGDLPGAIEAMRDIADTMTHEDIVAAPRRRSASSSRSARRASARHVNVGGPMGMRALAALIEVREGWRDLVDLQLVALVAHPLAGQAGRDLRQALARGRRRRGRLPAP